MFIRFFYYKPNAQSFIEEFNLHTTKLTVSSFKVRLDEYEVPSHIQQVIDEFGTNLAFKLPPEQVNRIMKFYDVFVPKNHTTKKLEDALVRH